MAAMPILNTLCQDAYQLQIGKIIDYVYIHENHL